MKKRWLAAGNENRDEKGNSNSQEDIHDETQIIAREHHWEQILKRVVCQVFRIIIGSK